MNLWYMINGRCIYMCIGLSVCIVCIINYYYIYMLCVNISLVGCCRIVCALTFYIFFVIIIYYT